MPKRTITPELELVKLDRLIERLRRRLKRTINALDKAERKRKRLIRPAPMPKPTPEEARLDQLAAEYEPAENVGTSDPQASLPVANVGTAGAQAAEDLTIPTFLIRDRAAEEAAGRERDRIAAEAIRQEQEERKKTRAQIRREENSAKQSGVTKRLPLQGKAALDAIARGAV
jgi:hypothetical protein